MNLPDINLSIDEVLARWDHDEPIFTIELGGLGPSYEQCIQVLAFELVRAFTELTWPCPVSTVNAARDAVIARLNPQYHFSGAQAAQATKLATAIVRDGYAETMRNRPLILVSRSFPPAITEKHR